jgi:hypothetical protein
MINQRRAETGRPSLEVGISSGLKATQKYYYASFATMT